MAKIVTLHKESIIDILNKHNIDYITEGKDKITVDLDLNKYNFKIQSELAERILHKDFFREWKKERLNDIIRSMY